MLRLEAFDPDNEQKENPIGDLLITNRRRIVTKTKKTQAFPMILILWSYSRWVWLGMLGSSSRTEYGQQQVAESDSTRIQSRGLTLALTCCRKRERRRSGRWRQSGAALC